MTSVGSEVLIVGAGVSGLTTGVCLAERGVRVRILAERGPEETTSANAGAIWDPIYANHPKVFEWSGRTYDVLAALVAEGRPEVRMVPGVEASRARIDPPRWARTLPGYRVCTPEELPGGFLSGWHYTAPIIDMRPYLRYLAARLARAGGTIASGRLETLDEALALASIVVNCSGAGARDLVPDPEVEPIRGQLVAVRNPGIAEFFAEHTAELGEMTYVLPQGDVLLLGGSADKGQAEPVPDPAVAHGIIARCALVFPEVAHAEVLGHRTGIRPQRPRIRLEHVALGDRHLVHNYGHSGAGVSLSWGCATDVAELVASLPDRR
ncbi:MAG: FAD-dependent oxidoreductase [Actinoplanes sp.]